MNSRPRSRRHVVARTMCWLSIAILMTSLGGCANTIFDRYRCPPLKKYSATFQEKAAEQIPSAGGNVKQLVSDYGQLRDACRAMEATK